MDYSCLDKKADRGIAMTPEMIQAFWSCVDQQGADECWPWKKSARRDGYGIVSQGTRYGTRYAHRLAWRLSHGEIPKGLFVCHHCDNPPCCNPKHLWLGTAADNIADMDSKGRHGFRGASGEANGNAKLSRKQVEEIRVEYSLGGTSQAKLAAAFGVSQVAISHVVRGSTWKDKIP